MSGYKPDWIEKDHYILVNGKEEVVRDYAFVGAGRYDALTVKIGDQWHEYGVTGQMEPLPVPEGMLPAYIKTGEPVAFGDEEDIGFIHRAWLKRKSGETAGEVRVEIWESYFSCTLDKIRPVSSSQEDAEKTGKLLFYYLATEVDFSCRVQKVLAAGADITLCDKEGRTALEIARDVGKDSIADLIEAEQSRRAEDKRRRDLAAIEEAGMRGIPVEQARPPGRLVVKKGLRPG